MSTPTGQSRIPDFGMSDTSSNLELLENILAQSTPQSRLGRIQKKRGVRNTPEFKRVDGLPRRHWTEAEAQDLAVKMTEILRTSTGTMVLRPMQAVAILEIFARRGFLGPLRVGIGKTLTLALAAYVLQLKHPLLLVPAKLKAKEGSKKIPGKTEKELERYSKHWKIPYWIQVKSYESLGTDKNTHWLWENKIDGILADECHKLKNKRAARTRRVDAYWEDKHPIFVGVSGTIIKRSLHDFAHLAKWALGEGSPLPNNWTELEEWASAIDERPQSHTRMAPGALVKWSNGDEDLEAVRQGVGERIRSTPGILASSDSGPACSLEVCRVSAEAPKGIVEAFRILRTKEETPDGWKLIAGGLDVSRHANELALGYYSRWNPRAPELWLERRREWSQACRKVLKRGIIGLDTELQIANAAHRGKLNEETTIAHKQWVEIRDTFVPEPEPVWISDFAINFVARWLEQEKGLAFVAHVPFAQRLAEKTGLKYYGKQGQAQGQAQDKTYIEEAPKGPAICSWQSNYEGRNIQHIWEKALVVSPMGSGQTWEQTLGRLHRDGTEADTIYYDVLCNCAENEDSWAQAISDAQLLETQMGPQKLTSVADIVWERQRTKDPVWDRYYWEEDNLPYGRKAT